MKRPRPISSKVAYRRLWRIVDGAIADTFSSHPEYLTRPGQKYARDSIAKRVIGAVLGYAEQSARGRSGIGPAAEKAEPLVSVPASTGAVAVVSSSGGSPCKGGSPLTLNDHAAPIGLQHSENA